MKPMIGKSIDQSMTIDALLVNWHRLASANRWPIDNHTKVVATHRLSLIGVKKISVIPTRSSMYVYALAVRTNVWDLNSFTGLFVCSMHGFKNQKNQQQQHTLKQCFEETQVNNTPFRLAVPFAVLYTALHWMIFNFKALAFNLLWSQSHHNSSTWWRIENWYCYKIVRPCSPRCINHHC